MYTKKGECRKSYDKIRQKSTPQLLLFFFAIVWFLLTIFIFEHDKPQGVDLCILLGTIATQILLLFSFVLPENMSRIVAATISHIGYSIFMLIVPLCVDNLNMLLLHVFVSVLTMATRKKNPCVFASMDNNNLRKFEKQLEKTVNWDVDIFFPAMAVASLLRITLILN